MDLSKKDRLIIANQLKILEKLYPEEAKEYSNQRKAVEQGYKIHYSRLVEWLYEEMSVDESEEILEILEMYRAITFSYNKTEDKEGLKESEIGFLGFDGNSEGKQLAYATYFILDLGRYGELRGDLVFPDFNSHGSMCVEDYRRMLAIWKKYEKSHSLTISQVKKILEA